MHRVTLRLARRCGHRSRGAAQPFTHFDHHHFPGFGRSPDFGVRRPLRFLAWKLQLDEPQIEKLAVLLDQVKIERAQAEVDDRRALSLLAEAAEGETFDRAKAEEARSIRTNSVERLQRTVAENMERIHSILKTEQRARLAYLLRTGSLVM